MDISEWIIICICIYITVIKNVPGKELNTADHLSRSPITLMDQMQDAKDREFQSEVEGLLI